LKKEKEVTIMGGNKYLNQDLSLLAFQARVLENAFDTQYPLLTRLTFISIVSKNLDEYYMLKFPRIKARAENGSSEIMDDVNYKQLTLEISTTIERLYDRISIASEEIFKALEKENIYIRTLDHLGADELARLETYFYLNIRPFLTPTILDPAHPFPLIPSGCLNLAYKFGYTTSQETYYMLVVVPQQLKRFIRLELNKKEHAYVLLEDVIHHFIQKLLPEKSVRYDHCLFKLLRDNIIHLGEDIKNMSINLGGVIMKRKNRKVSKVYIQTDISQNMQNFLIHNLHIESEDFIKIKTHLGMESFHKLVPPDRKDLLLPEYTPRFPNRIADYGGDYFKAISEKDILVHHPFESFNVFLGFLRQAVRDPDVVTIKQTLYRTSPDSPLISELITAAENGKQVVTLVELRASMDEENNIQLAKVLENNGIQVVYGSLAYKTHAKLCLVVRQTESGIEEYMHIGTGNYHPQNATQYTDLSLFTCNPDTCNEANDLFNFVTSSVPPSHSRKIFVSPLTLKSRILQMIEQEIRNHKEGHPSGIWLKCNGLSDSVMIDALYRASSAGVQCQLIVRGICCLRPGVEGLSENISVKSVVGRYLEHSRIYCFGNGEALPSSKNKVYITSADLMPRNLDYRIEAMIEIDNPTVHAQLTQEIFSHYLSDTRNSWEMKSDGTYTSLNNPAKENLDAHQYFMTHKSLSGQTTRF
jgi:polyphosphate kinase